MAVWPSRHHHEVRVPRGCTRVVVTDERTYMWNLADRVVKAVSDVTVGTVIVLVHVALADRRGMYHGERWPLGGSNAQHRASARSREGIAS